MFEFVIMFKDHELCINSDFQVNEYHLQRRVQNGFEILGEILTEVKMSTLFQKRTSYQECHTVNCLSKRSTFHFLCF